MKTWSRTACIHLTGGEPLLKPELFPLLDDLHHRRSVEELGLITNGLGLSSGVLQKLSAYPKLKKMKVSLDGADADVNDSIRRRGTFDKVMRNLQRVKEEGRFETILMFTVMRRNCKELPALIDLCEKSGVDGLILERFIPWGRGRQIMNEVLGSDDWREIVGTLCRLFSISPEDESLLPHQAFQIQFEEGEAELLGAPCMIGTDGLCLMPGGEVYPCRRFPVALGNLLKDPLNDLWQHSPLLNTLRKKENLKGRCGACKIRDCRGCRSLAFATTGDYLEEDPHCWFDRES